MHLAPMAVSWTSLEHSLSRRCGIQVDRSLRLYHAVRRVLATVVCHQCVGGSGWLEEPCEYLKLRSSIDVRSSLDKQLHKDDSQASKANDWRTTILNNARIITLSCRTGFSAVRFRPSSGLATNRAKHLFRYTLHGNVISLGA